MAEKQTWEVMRKMRKGLGIRQGELAKQVGISDSALSKWEHGALKVNEETVNKIIEIIDAAVMQRAESTRGPLANSEREALKRMRKMYGIGQIEVARKAQISQSIISLYENGHVELDAEEMERLEKAIGALIIKDMEARGFDPHKRGMLSQLAGKPRISPTEARKDKQIEMLWQVIASLRKELIALQEERSPEAKPIEKEHGE